MRTVHLYPFPPHGRHGGTLRLRAAVSASATLGETELHWFDPSARCWRGPEPAERVDELLGSPPLPTHAGPSLKRAIFPSTLWESGAKARRALRGHRERLDLDEESIVVVHTSYLAPALSSLAVAPERAALDLYDLVWRAHFADALAGRALLGLARRGYAAAVRRREESAIGGFGAVLVAAYDEHAAIRARVPGARWIPTPTPVEPVERPRSPGEPLAVGLIGNFAHRPTAESARLLLHSALADDPSVRVVLAGLHSDAVLGEHPRVRAVGPVVRAETFYRDVDCVVAPVRSASGLKVKLAEGVLAGCPVMTTRAGASGYPPELARHFHVCEMDALKATEVRDAVERFQPASAREAFERVLGWPAVVRRYADALRTLAVAR